MNGPAGHKDRRGHLFPPQGNFVLARHPPRNAFREHVWTMAQMPPVHNACCYLCICQMNGPADHKDRRGHLFPPQGNLSGFSSAKAATGPRNSHEFQRMQMSKNAG